MSKILDFLIESREKEIFVDLSRKGDDKLTRSGKQQGRVKKSQQDGV